MLISEGFTCLEANWVKTVPFCSVFTFINLTANLGVPQPGSTPYHSICGCPGSLSPEYRLLFSHEKNIVKVLGIGLGMGLGRDLQ